MSSTNPFFAYWYFHVPNLIFAALMYTALGRVVLSFIFEPESSNYIWRFFVRITDPVVRLVRYVTPCAVSPFFVLVFSVVWLFAARIGLLILITALGVAPTAGVSP